MNSRLSRSVRRCRWTSSKVYQCCRGKSQRHRSCCDFTSTAFFTSGSPGKAKYSRSTAGIAKRPLSSSLHGNSPANIPSPSCCARLLHRANDPAKCCARLVALVGATVSAQGRLRPFPVAPTRHCPRRGWVAYILTRYLLYLAGLQVHINRQTVKQLSIPIKAGRLRCGCKCLTGSLRHAQGLPHLPFDGCPHLRMLFQIQLGILASLTDTFLGVSKPGPTLLDDLTLHSQIEQLAGSANPIAIHNIKFHLSEGRGHLVFDDFHPCAVADHLLTGLNRVETANIEPDRGIEF